MTAYKLLRLRADGTLGPLFVGRGQVMRPRGTYAARADLPHPGLAHRPGFHCTAKPRAPHIKLRLKNGERRVWCEVRLSGRVTPHLRPERQGGLWYTAERMQIVRVLDPAAADDVCAQCGGTGSYLSETAARYGDAAYVCPSCAGTGRRITTNGGKEETMAKPKRVVDVEIMVTVSEADGNAAIRSLQHWFDVNYIGMRVKKPARASKPRRPTKVEQPLTE